MRTEFLPLSRPSINQEDINAVSEVLRSGWITTGPQTAAFEQAFCDYVGCRGAVALSSATAGMHLVLQALGIGPGDEVITPSMTWVSTVNLIVLSGARPVFVDVDRDTLMVPPEVVRSRMTPRTKLVVPVHFAGAALDLDGMRRVAAEGGVALVEDAAHAAGTRYRNVPVGQRGTSIFSFHPIKNITTAEGGMVCSDDPSLLDRIRRLRFHGLGVDAYDREMQGRSAQAQVLEPGFKYNLTDLSAALGRQQLIRIEEFISRRAELVERYRERLRLVEEIHPLADPAYPVRHARHLFVVRLDTDRVGMSRHEFMAELKRRNIGTGLHYLAVHVQRYYAEQMGFQRGTLPHTEWNSDRICSLPLFPDMRPEDVDDVVAAIKDILSNRRCG